MSKTTELARKNQIIRAIFERKCKKQQKATEKAKNCAQNVGNLRIPPRQSTFSRKKLTFCKNPANFLTICEKSALHADSPKNHKMPRIRRHQKAKKHHPKNQKQRKMGVFEPFFSRVEIFGFLALIFDYSQPIGQQMVMA
ncbi:MAG TPA: hypothetical protein P5169_02540 [Kiritimatiellia bacterium]|nr:hypothetical protein [Lentisphaerota bacterium]HRV30561.1 hypothetical protein [Kiritimatiellia bacterium]